MVHTDLKAIATEIYTSAEINGAECPSCMVQDLAEESGLDYRAALSFVDEVVIESQARRAYWR